MGMDGVELVMEVENAFDIQIQDAEAEKLLTPRLLIDFVQSRVAVTAVSVCLTQRAFNLLRKSLLRHGDWKRTQIIPAADLGALIPRNRRRPLLEIVLGELGINKSPTFGRPNWLNALLLGGAVLAGLFVAILATGYVSLSVTIFAFIGVAILTAGLGLRLTKPLCKEFPKELKTIGDLARWIMTHKADLATASIPAWTRDQIAARVREIIVDVLGCKPDFREDANFVKDLGLS